MLIDILIVCLSGLLSDNLFRDKFNICHLIDKGCTRPKYCLFSQSIRKKKY